MTVESTRILGITLHKVTTTQTLALLEQYITEGKPRQVVTLNPEFVMEAQRNAHFRVVIGEADLVLADGHGLLWAARVLGDRLPERVTGSDTVPLIAEMAAQRGYRLFLLGAAPGVAEKAAAVLQSRHPGLDIAGTYAGSPAPEEEDAIVARIQAAHPHFLFVAYGAPRQDIWIHRNLARLGVPVCMGVGGTLDFIAGIVPRAPVWMRQHGLEWLYRLVRQPWRWRRMLVLPRFVLRILQFRLLGA
jgi:N-acetylglucosaminyldiphosphoundecaprenol N-acetyl-beta-D-mannosaminyltransferase